MPPSSDRGKSLLTQKLPARKGRALNTIVMALAQPGEPRQPTCSNQDGALYVKKKFAGLPDAIGPANFYLVKNH